MDKHGNTWADSKTATPTEDVKMALKKHQDGAHSSVEGRVDKIEWWGYLHQ